MKYENKIREICNNASLNNHQSGYVLCFYIKNNKVHLEYLTSGILNHNFEIFLKIPAEIKDNNTLFQYIITYVKENNYANAF